MSNVPLMNSARKTLPLLIATLAPFCGAAAHAAGLGELTAHSSLGEPLRAEVRLMRAPGEDIDASCVKAVTGGSDDIPWIHNARIRLAGDRLQITTREPVNHPIAMLGLRVACGFELRREFTLLLSPPTIRNAVAPLDIPVNTPIVAPGKLPADVPLSSPTASRRAATPPATSPRSPRTPAATTARPAQASSRSAPSARLAEATPTGATTPARAAAPRAADPIRQDRLLIGAGDEAGLVPLRMSSLLANPPKSDDSGVQPPQRSQEQRTLAEIDDRIAAQLELDEKIKRLEEYQALLKERVAQLDQNRKPATAPAPAQVTPAAAPATATDDMQALLEQWTGPVAGLLAVLLGGGALIYLRRRRNATDVPVMSEPEFHTTLQHPGQPSASGPGAVIGLATPAASTEALSSLPEMRTPAIAHGNAPTPAEASGEWAEPTFAPAHPIPFDENVDEHDSALELAEIMMSFGRTQGAAETLADYIRNNPRQAVKPWLKLLEVYHVAGMRAEFEALTRQLNKTFNVKMISWSDFKTLRSGADTVEQIPHVVQRLQALWGTQEAQAYIHQILRDNRNGTRQGFPLTVVEELLLLLAILDDELGTYKPPTELSLVDMETPPSAEDRNTAAA